MEYPALVELAEEGGFVVRFPEFEWGITQGDSEDEAREMALDAICTMIQERIRTGETLPRPSRARGGRYRMIRLPALQAIKVELYQEFVRSGMRKTDLARRLGIAKTAIDRLFDLQHNSRLDQIEAAFRALGKEIRIQISNAA